MVQRRIGEEIDHTAAGASFGIGSTPDDPPDSSVLDRARAHGAGLQRHIEITARQAVIAQRLSGRPHGLDFGMRGRVMQADRVIEPTSNHRAVSNHNRTDWHFTQSASPSRLIDRQLHECSVGFGLTASGGLSGCHRA